MELKDKPLKMFNGGSWTQARFNSFIKSLLRAGTFKWPPKNKVKQKARIERGIYLCEGYKRKSHRVPATLPPKKGSKRRINNSVVDHIEPIIDPKVGFVSWDEVIKRMFCEADNLQILCYDCHTRKSMDEREIKKNAKRTVRI